MKTLTFKSTKGGKFNVNLPDNYKKVKLPFFKQWVAALESGNFRQCNGTLCEPNNKKLTYCCLGVLSKIQGRLVKNKEYNAYEDGENTLETSGLDDRNPVYSILKNDGTLPKGVSVATDDDYKCTSLVSCNDELDLSFKDIVKVIKTIYKA